MSRATYAAVAAFLSCTGILVAGCKKQPTSPEATAAELDAIYKRYVSGSAAEAKASLIRAIEVLDGAKLEPDRDASIRFLTFARLYALCHKMGADAEAEAYLVEARYWRLREEELTGMTKQDAGRVVQEWTGDRIVRFVEEWDRRVNKGPPAAYGDAGGKREP